jgi:alpha-L-rhamnosidase
VIVRPRPSGGLTHAEGTLDSMHGRIATAWRREGDRLSLEVTIPTNTSAMVFVPAASRESVTESGQPAEKVTGIQFLRLVGGAAVYEIPSGHYQFASTLAPERATR